MNLARCAPGRNHHQPDLFEWADRQRRIYRLPLAARHLQRRFGLSPAAATVTAELAGFPTGSR
jgi:hypothetical protein